MRSVREFCACICTNTGCLKSENSAFGSAKEKNLPRVYFYIQKNMIGGQTVQFLL